MTDRLATLAFCAALILAGWWWVEVLLRDRPGIAVRASFGYLIGTATVTLLELGVAFLSVPIGRGAVLGSVIFSAVSGWAVTRRRMPAPVPAIPGAMWPALILLVPAAIALGSGVAHAVTLGHVDQDDFLRAWGKKALYLYYYRDLDFRNPGVTHGYYPLEVSNLFGSLYLLLGHVNDAVVRLQLVLYAVATAPASWWLLRRVLPPAGAAGAVSLALATPQVVIHSARGQADIAAAAYVTIAALAAFLWLLDGGSRYAALCGLMAGAAGWTKVEGAFTAAVIVLAVIAVRRSLRTPGLVVCVAWFAAFVVPWELFRKLHHITASTRHFSALYLDLPWILRHVAHSLESVNKWGVFWPLCLALILLTAPFWLRSRMRLLAAVTLPNVVITLVAFMIHYRAGTPGSVSVTAPRLYLHLAPSVAMMAAAGVTVAVAALRTAGEPAPSEAEEGGAWPHKTRSPAQA